MGAALIVLVAAASAAHENHVHKRLFGTVTAVAPERLDFQDRDGTGQSVRITKQTRVLRGSARVQPTEIRVGDRVVVGVSSDAPPYTAVEIRLGEPK